MYDQALNALQDARKAIDKLEQEVARLRAAATGAEAMVQSITPVKLTWVFSTSISNQWGTPSVAAIVQDNTARLNKEWATIDATHVANLPLIASNQAIRQQVEALMKAIGIPDEYTVYESSGRSRTPKQVKRPAGWISDLARCCKVDDGYDLAKRAYEEAQRKIQEWQIAQQQKEAAEAKQREAEQKKADAERLRAVMVVKYGCNYNADLSEVLEAILRRNKYLHLAYWLERNRNDWHDGPDSARTGLDSFTIESPQDQAIYEELSDLINEWDGDGRVFRDCEWNYSRIYNLVGDDALMADFNSVRQSLPYGEGW